jgi:hypothetical protein
MQGKYIKHCRACSIIANCHSLWVLADILDFLSDMLSETFAKTRLVSGNVI